MINVVKRSPVGQFWNESASVCQVDASPLTLKQSAAATFGDWDEKYSQKGNVPPPSLPHSNSGQSGFNSPSEHVLLRVRS